MSDGSAGADSCQVQTRLDLAEDSPPNKFEGATQHTVVSCGGRVFRLGHIDSAESEDSAGTTDEITCFWNSRR